MPNAQMGPQKSESSSDDAMLNFNSRTSPALEDKNGGPRLCADAAEMLKEHLFRYPQLRKPKIKVYFNTAEGRPNVKPVRFNPPATGHPVTFHVTVSQQGESGVRGTIEVEGYSPENLYSLLQTKPPPPPKAEKRSPPPDLSFPTQSEAPVKRQTVMEIMLLEEPPGEFKHMVCLLEAFADDLSSRTSGRQTEHVKFLFAEWMTLIADMDPSEDDISAVIDWMKERRWIKHPEGSSVRQRLVINGDGWYIVDEIRKSLGSTFQKRKAGRKTVTSSESGAPLTPIAVPAVQADNQDRRPDPVVMLPVPLQLKPDDVVLQRVQVNRRDDEGKTVSSRLITVPLSGNARPATPAGLNGNHAKSPDSPVPANSVPQKTGVASLFPTLALIGALDQDTQGAQAKLVTMDEELATLEKDLANKRKELEETESRFETLRTERQKLHEQLSPAQQMIARLRSVRAALQQPK